ncbi:hypothetical protein [Haloferula sp. BvORR071]|uniref:hypothetical protein n=1 Tax=Haloferula sp. BvORR071 TaxID=1396141 RepID=UPI000551D174|nr:hypothetical protein [Haloferula sp. BvORR071]
MKIASVLLLVLGFSVVHAEDDLQKIIEEREGVLKQLVELTEARHKAGGASQEDVFEASMRLLKFKVNVVADPAEKLSIQEQIVKLAEDNLMHVKKMFEAGAAVKFAVLKAQDRTLEEKQILFALKAAKP